MGEAPKLSSNEAELFVSTVLKQVNQKVPVIVGVSNAGLDNVVNLSKISMDQGAAGVMIAPTVGLGTEMKVYNYFAKVLEALGDDIPVCYQDYPFLTKSEISVHTFNRLVNDYKQLVMLKHEEWPGLDKLSKVKASMDTGDIRRISILTGNGGLYLPQELQRGADGAMTGFAYPEMLVEVYDLHKKGDTDAAENLFDAYLPYVRYEQQPGFGLAVRKETLFRRGAINSPAVRQPGPNLSSQDEAELTRLISRVERNLGLR
jgi:4-hydroxy-tetrahydrodipicolinate synthase